MSQDLPFFAFLHTALVFVELSAWASTEPVRRAVTQPSPCPALTWLVGTCAPPTSVRTALASARRAPCLACQPALAPGLDGCGGRSWLSNHPGLAFLEHGWGGRPGARPLAMLWSLPRYLGWLVLEPGSGVRPLAEVGGHLLKRGSLRRSGEENRVRAHVRIARVARLQPTAKRTKIRWFQLLKEKPNII